MHLCGIFTDTFSTHSLNLFIKAHLNPTRLILNKISCAHVIPCAETHIIPAVLRAHILPSFWFSSSHRATALLLKLESPICIIHKELLSSSWEDKWHHICKAFCIYLASFLAEFQVL